MALDFKPFVRCEELHPKNGNQCERETGHPVEPADMSQPTYNCHYYSIWADGMPFGPVLWPIKE